MVRDAAQLVLGAGLLAAAVAIHYLRRAIEAQQEQLRLLQQRLDSRPTR